MKNEIPKYMCFTCKKENCEHRNKSKKEDFKNSVSNYCNYGFLKIVNK